MVFLPEACDYVAKSKSQTIEMAEGVDGETVQYFKQLAQQNDVWLSLGGVHIKVRSKHLHLDLNKNSFRNFIFTFFNFV